MWNVRILLQTQLFWVIRVGTSITSEVAYFRVEVAIKSSDLMIALYSSRKMLPQEPALDLVIISLCLHIQRLRSLSASPRSTSCLTCFAVGDHPRGLPAASYPDPKSHCTPALSCLSVLEHEPFQPSTVGPPSLPSSGRFPSVLLPSRPSWKWHLPWPSSCSRPLLSPMHFYRSLHSGHLLQYLFTDQVIVWNHPFPKIYIWNRIGKLESSSSCMALELKLLYIFKGLFTHF